MASYAGLHDKELRVLLKQGKRSRIRCEYGHDDCGASRESSQDGRAPCLVELQREANWRSVATQTVEG
jgi:hypothetical protein